MRSAHTVAQIRAAEAAAAADLPPGTLMDRAATGLARICQSMLGRIYGSPVVLLVGSGDNGGDALFAGAHLARRGAGVHAILLDPDRAHAAGLTAFRQAGGRVTADPAVLDRAFLVLDGIVGIGATGGLRPEAAALVERAEIGGGLVVAVDLPSGVDADTGRTPGAFVHADVTVTFGTWRIGLLVDPGARLAGATTCVDIGLEPYLPEPVVRSLQTADLEWFLPRPGPADDKYSRGVLGIVAGSAGYPGAAALTVAGAQGAGAGMIRFVGAPEIGRAVLAGAPEVVVSEGRPTQAGRVQAWVVGPGMGTDEAADVLLRDVLSSDVPVLVDADGLTLLAHNGFPERRAPTLFTPHAGELARLLGTDRASVEASRLAHARQAAERFGVHVLLKGSTTVVVGPGGTEAWANSTGSAWSATAGSGDVLSGVAGALLAAGLPMGRAGALAAHVHGLAAQKASDLGRPVTAGDIAAHVPEAWEIPAG
ncbi:MAG: NAD(P)H-hydrate dehydratase [Sporichthyaceae bacterium]